MRTYYSDIILEDNTPKSVLFDDIYYSKHSGVEEANYVFIKHNNLENRFTSLKDNDIFVIAESGFGAGINFLTTLILWDQVVTSNAKLIFYSFEKYPLKQETLQVILDNIVEFKKIKNELIAQYYLLTMGCHRIKFKNVFLNLIIGDINSTIKNYTFKANAWFLDGFNPNKNISMWSDTVFKNMSRLSENEATFATYSANSRIQQLLNVNGFIVKKTKGFYKREMIFGFKNNEISYKTTYIKPWLQKYNVKTNKKVAIIGSGLSGLFTAYALKNRGYDVTIFEKSNKLGTDASGNYQGALYGNFYGNNLNALELNFSSYRYSHYLINKILKDSNAIDNCGLILIPKNNKELKQQQNLLQSHIPPEFCRYVSKSQMQELANHDIFEENGLYFPFGLWVNPQKLLSTLAKNIIVQFNTEITNLEQLNDDSWNLYRDNKCIFNTQTVILCNSHNFNKYPITKNLKIRKIRGQTSVINQPNNLKTIICKNGYIMPSFNNKYTIGATFKCNEETVEMREYEHLENITNIKDIFPNINTKNIDGNVGIRSCAYDYFPIVGPISDYNKFINYYSKLKVDKNFKINTTCPYLKGLFANVGHGSKGLLTIPLASEIIADYIENLPNLCGNNLLEKIIPNRLYINLLTQEHKK